MPLTTKVNVAAEPGAAAEQQRTRVTVEIYDGAGGDRHSYLVDVSVHWDSKVARLLNVITNGASYSSENEGVVLWAHQSIKKGLDKQESRKFELQFETPTAPVLFVACVQDPLREGTLGQNTVSAEFP